MTPPAAAAAAPAPATRRARVSAPPRPTVAPRNPRRVSGPARTPARRPARPRAPSVQAERGLALGVLEALRGLAGNRSLDRLIRSRTWIALITFALLGIVTLQLLVLRLNANIGHALVRESQLQRENAALSIESSELASGERVEFQAAHLGMELVPEGSLRFLTSDSHSDIARAVAALKAPVHSSNTNPSSSSTSSTTAASASTGESSEASSGEATAETSPAGAQASAETEEPATSTSGSTETGETPAGTEAPPGEVPTSAPSSSAAATATGAAEAAVGGVGAAG
jgi:hypothetical protein